MRGFQRSWQATGPPPFSEVCVNLNNNFDHNNLISLYFTSLLLIVLKEDGLRWRKHTKAGRDGESKEEG